LVETTKWAADLEGLGELVSKFKQKGNIIIMGDFNCHVGNRVIYDSIIDIKGELLCNFCINFGFRILNECSSDYDSGFDSDHIPISCILNTNWLTATKQKIYSWDLKKINNISFKITISLWCKNFNEIFN